MPEKTYSNDIVDEQKLMQFMVLKNALYYDYKTDDDDKCLIEYNLKLIDKRDRADYKNWKNVLYLFEEISQYNCDSSKSNLFISNLFVKIMEEKPEELDKKFELKLPKKHFLLGLAMIYLDYFVEFQESVEIEEAFFSDDEEGIEEIEVNENCLVSLFSFTLDFDATIA